MEINYNVRSEAVGWPVRSANPEVTLACLRRPYNTFLHVQQPSDIRRLKNEDAPWFRSSP